MKRLYIAGPVTGMPAHNYPAFDRVATKYERLGWVVVSPASIGREYGALQEPVSPAVEMLIRRTTLIALMRCDAIVMLPGWQRSWGARVEHDMASYFNLTIDYEAADAEEEASVK